MGIAALFECCRCTPCVTYRNYEGRVRPRLVESLDVWSGAHEEEGGVRADDPLSHALSHHALSPNVVLGYLLVGGRVVRYRQGGGD